MPMHRRAHAGLTSDKHITRVRHARGAGAPSMPQIFRPGPRLPAALSTCLFVYTVPTRNVQRGSWVNTFRSLEGCMFGFGRLSLCSFALGGVLSAQTPAKVDFAQDVLPILRQNCVGCHGPALQTSGLRLDRKSVVFSRRKVVPGSSDNSFLFHRISGNAYGMQMPPTGPLRPEQINTIKMWIDQGAEWPDSLANEAEIPPLNPKAVAMVEALRSANLPGFMQSAAEDPELLNARGPEGSTPFK